MPDTPVNPHDPGTAESAADQQRYAVVVNDEEQYSIWPAGRDLPPGWRTAGPTGAKAECLEHIEQVWTDMRPLSLRRELERSTRTGEA